MFHDDDNQIEPPPSFVLLYTAPSGQRLLKPADHVRDRYELCEDMAQVLTQRTAAMQFRTERSQAQVLAQLAQALNDSESPLPAPEIDWVVRRVAELLGWEQQPAQ